MKIAECGVGIMAKASQLVKTKVSKKVDTSCSLEKFFDDGIVITRAREHNLKNVSITVPRNKITVFTGLSGSGKSSLAFDTVYAEGQRRYVESLSAYARHFLEQLKKPEVDSITGLSPAIAIDQKSVGLNPRSTVGTVTEIYDYLRLLYAKVGTPECPEHHIPVESQSPQQIIDDIFKKSMGTKFLILAPMAQSKKGEFLAEFQKWAKKGFIKAKVDGEYVELERATKLAKTKTHDIDLVIDQLVLKETIKHRLSESINTALSMANGRLIIETVGGERTNYSLHSSCPKCGFSFPEMEPRLFSFNNPRGACLTCHGLGTLDLVEEEQFSDSEVGGRKLENVKYTYKGKKVTEVESDDEDSEEMILSTCPDCQGHRLKKESLSVKVGEKNIAELSDLSIIELAAFLQKLKWKEKHTFIADKILKQILSRLEFLKRVGTSYLSLSRPARTLSGGEAQRIRLATQVGSALIGCMYVMDEPSIGLHPRDHHRLLEIIGELKDRGNTIILVEHDEDTIRAADYLLDIGPGAGIHGGHVVAAGSPAEVMKVKNSLTAQYLEGSKKIAVPAKRRKGNGKKLSIVGARENNLRNVSVDIPLGELVVVSGVSGSGKSSLINDILAKELQARLHRASTVPGKHDSIEGIKELDKAIIIDQSPIGRTPRSNPATYTGLFGPIRELFASLPDAKLRGYTPGRFSFNVKGGRCENCAGDGIIKIEMHFLPDVYVPCEVCHGKRYNREALEIHYKGKTIADVLAMTCEQALEFFKNQPAIARKLQTLVDVGLGYISLGQSATTLSGGEAQRIKLSTELSRRPTGRTLYILDEPTTGLHMADVDKLLQMLHALVDAGNSMVVIEHNLDVIKNADWILDMGPEGGAGGGQVVAEGTPEQVAKNDKSYTGQYLSKMS